MPNVTVTWLPKDLSVWRDDKVAKSAMRALAKAGGDGLRAMRTAGTRMVRERKRLKVARVNRGLTLLFPSSKQRLIWRMQVSGAPVPLAEYPHRQVKSGVSVEVNVGRRKLVRSAFVATMKSGHEGIFKRRGKKRLPIAEAFSTRISDVFGDRGGAAAQSVLTSGLVKMNATFERLLPVELAKIR